MFLEIFLVMARYITGYNSRGNFWRKKLSQREEYHYTNRNGTMVFRSGHHEWRLYKNGKLGRFKIRPKLFTDKDFFGQKIFFAQK